MHLPSWLLSFMRNPSKLSSDSSISSADCARINRWSTALSSFSCSLSICPSSLRHASLYSIFLTCLDCSLNWLCLSTYCWWAAACRRVFHKFCCTFDIWSDFASAASPKFSFFSLKTKAFFCFEMFWICCLCLIVIFKCFELLISNHHLLFNIMKHEQKKDDRIMR